MNIQILIIFLAKNFLNLIIQNYILYFDNLFINISLADALEQLDIEIMSITQATAKKLSLSLIQLKHAKESLK